MMQECFADLEESEQLMMAEQEASEGALTMTVVRAPVLRDSSSYVHDYAAGDLVTCLRTFLLKFIFFLEYLLLSTVQERRGRSPATTSSRPATARTSPPCSLTGSRSQYIHYLLEQYYLLHDCRLRPGSWTWRRAGSGTARSSPWPGSRRPRRQKLSHNIVLLILATLHNQEYNVL